MSTAYYYDSAQDYGTTFNVNAKTMVKKQQAIDNAPPFQSISKAKLIEMRFSCSGFLILLLVPWLLFVAIYSAMSFSIRYQSPAWSYCIDAVGLLFVIGLGISAVNTNRAYNAETSNRHPAWAIFMFVTCLAAWVAGIVCGDFSYSSYTHPYMEIENLDFYPQVNPAAGDAQKYIDAGRIIFEDGSKLDISRSMSFKQSDVYCVAPIVNGNGNMPSYEFWAVGINCCNPTQNSFECGDANVMGARGGLRLMNEAARPFYRLAVQQAEATYKLQAPHPLFFEWVQDPIGHSTELQTNLGSMLVKNIIIALFIQMFLVTVGLFAFTKAAPWSLWA